MPLASDLMGNSSNDSLVRCRDANELAREQMRLFMTPLAGEELYDTVRDLWEFTNLAGNPNYRPNLERLRAECARWIASYNDVSPEKRIKDNLDISTGDMMPRR